MSDESGRAFSCARVRSCSQMSPPDTIAKIAATVPNCPSCQGVSSTPSVTGIVDWNTIAPATLPSAMTSFPSFVQMRLFAASGSSVASGARTSATRSVLKPIACEKSSTKSAKNRAPTTAAAAAEGKRGDADEQHHEGAEHERRAEDRADADLVGIRCVREEDGDDGD